MSKYSTPTWASITPIPLDDGSTYYDNNDPERQGKGVSGNGTYPLATIAYAPEYEEATSYLRAVMAANEMSERALELTGDVILMNPAHYTVWLYRAQILVALKKDLNEEIEWVNKLALQCLKNYQIWHHRQLIMSNLEAFPTLPGTEQQFLMQVFALDSKNYHVWTYRHWLVRHFKLWDHPQELADVETLIDQDVRNNSAWNHRWTLKFGPRGDVDSGMPVGVVDKHGPKGSLDVVDEELIDAELEYAKDKILLAPENKSPWAYARGVLRAAGRPLAELKGFAAKFILEEVDSEGSVVKCQVKSSLAVEWLADVYVEEAEEKDAEEEKARKAEAVRMLTLLKDKYDPIRKNYWDYRIRMLDGESVAVA
ncbi:CaaX farnesyltransferase alpha subunit Ram2, variant [Blastomyces dermatitidis ER-3]|uniref:Protein farnesyltransferase/geranylgeranyltransferase type-1 subunit alpha n=1 Tax=Ajellomyces dermatitidis (strain ER-3 / ATCC MYA-2586) TaxID=559297 RepID=A0ABP2EWX0_AJEDR|nr:CaaX farnesyltransferase alpha subunit Ram2 [Blastomyces dermatitidis ER-3]XP_045280570.1 CaaX farnesyltransferase alpha subunit Ram2, variant [Blastomyces dermatitidis ER-3]EEQ88584.1 CaaX farnesyltransferase alpha subunit Ram2 [Blastomyces dermatitidis ER-3]OAT00843.1 CaaX farnesyltransferase alpha subunit Ram2, variant [Blastomyces dermatitidis ER-3]